MSDLIVFHLFFLSGYLRNVYFRHINFLLFHPINLLFLLL